MTVARQLEGRLRNLFFLQQNCRDACHTKNRSSAIFCLCRAVNITGNTKNFVQISTVWVLFNNWKSER